MYVKTWGPQLYCGKGSCGEFVTAACERCGREFEARTRDREHGWGRFTGSRVRCVHAGLGERELAQSEVRA